MFLRSLADHPKRSRPLWALHRSSSCCPLPSVGSRSRSLSPKLLRQGGGGEKLRLGPAVYIPCTEGFLAAAMSSNPQLVQAAIVFARLAGWRLAVWNAPDDPTSRRPRYRPPPPSFLRKPEKETTDATTRAIALATRAISETDITIIAPVDRGPCLLEFGGRRATKAAVLAQVTSAAHMAMQQFVRGHYAQSLPHAHVRTAFPSVSHRRIDDPAKQHADHFRLRVRVRLRIANTNAHRQPRIEAVGGSSCLEWFLKLADSASKTLRRRTIATQSVLCGVPVISIPPKRCPGGVVVQKSTQMAVSQCEWAVARAFRRGTGSKERSVGGGHAQDSPPLVARSIVRWVWARNSGRAVEIEERCAHRTALPRLS